MTVTTTEIRQTVVNEAIERAASERSLLFVCEYKGKLFDQMIWATLIEREQLCVGIEVLTWGLKFHTRK